MKHQIILWAGAVVITFLAGYFESISSANYPISGTIGVKGYKVSYLMPMEWKKNSSFKAIIRTDIDSLEGKIFWRKIGEENWKEKKLYQHENAMIGNVPVYPPLTEIEYKLEVYRDEKFYSINGNNPVKLKFYGEVNATIYYLYFFTLFAGILLSTRTGLEYFHQNEKIQKLTIFTIIFFFLYFITAPLKLTYEVGGFSRVPGLTELIEWKSVILFTVWILGMIFIFKKREQRRIIAISTAALTLLLFIII